MARYPIVKKVLLVIGCTAIAVLFSGFVLIYSKFNIMPYEWAWHLSGRIDTIDVRPIYWACDCADYTYYQTPLADLDTIPEDGFFFVEASDPSLKVRDRRESNDPKSAYNYIRLTGQFYTGLGISRTYELKTPEKPKSARVFRYDKIEYRLE